MSCDLFAGELAEAAVTGPRDDLARHLAGCETCASELAALERTVGAVERATDEPVALPVTLERLERAVAARRQRRRASLAAAVALFAGAAFFATAWRERASTRDEPPPARTELDPADLDAVLPETPPDDVFASASDDELATFVRARANDLLDADAGSLLARGRLHDEVERLDEDQLARALARFSY